ncbi:hypothetical protein Trco_002681 [Trichoderma cornu-damae]|uniref:Complex 1 LYR protein domain-containing protein n=1 Tax=Trichoderma cornu-damae TaxID=654480 RepID=A0A9P8QN51_9HYPO|nr:hypothetical protein Trco_002681 [Trichoderma cornu-damae]
MIPGIRLLHLSRGYATQRPASRLKTTISLDHRSRALALYRTIWRGTRRISDAQTRAESRKYARDEFERHRNVQDIVRQLASGAPTIRVKAIHSANFASHRKQVSHKISLINRQDRMGKHGERQRQHQHQHQPP